MNTRKSTETSTAALLGAEAVKAALGQGATTPFKTGLTGGNPKPAVTSAKGQPKAPATAPVKAAGEGKGATGGKGKGEVKPPPPAAPSVVVQPVTATKAVGMREGRLANPDYVEGFNLKRFGCPTGSDVRHPWFADAPAPTRADILAARALMGGKSPTSGNELSLACCLGLVGRWASIDGIGMLCSAVTNNDGSMKQNVVRRALGHGYAGYINPVTGDFTGSDKVTFKLPNHYNSGMRACAAIRPTAAGLALIEPVLKAAGLEVPDYMKASAAEIAALAEQAKAERKALRDAKKADKGAAAVAAKTKRSPTKRK